MKLTGTYRCPAPRARVYAALIDPVVLQRCIEGAEQLVRTAGDEYDVRMRIGIGAVKGVFSGTVRLADMQAPEAFTLHVEGKGAPGFVSGSARIRLDDAEPGTAITCDADGQVGGVLAAVGSRLVDAAGRRMMDRFFERLGREFDPPTTS
ncbi:MAG: carbon monoxide dehydrogenase subunit G [Acidobacteria bacterium]|nr:carbon monoxide dehydrogenase subunit G [Acidobacteriota bacterium]